MHAVNFDVVGYASTYTYNVNYLMSTPVGTRAFCFTLTF